MILIADSGSTKCDWKLVSETGESVGEFKTMGLNPYFHNEEVIRATLNGSAELMKHAADVKQLYFYGAGSSNKEMKRIVERGLALVFPKAHVLVDHDLVAAALATYDGEPCISCILGTGSNSCYFDGDIVREEVPALAYILGDEGSGSYYGKRILADYLYGKLPSELTEDLEAKYDVSKDIIFENVYRKPHANVYLASFSKFLSNHSNHPYVQRLVRKGMVDFLETHVACFRNYQKVPVHFIGSIAYYYQDILQYVCRDMGITLGKVIKKPIDGLVEYHVREHIVKTSA